MINMSLTDLQNLKAKRNRIIGMKKIDLLDIRPNTLNSFPQDDIEELKENIFAEGLQKPLEVYQDGDHFVLLGGHRRYNALVELLMDDKIDPDVNCIISAKPKDNADEELMIISSNAQRPMNDQLRLMLTQKLLNILEGNPTKKPAGMGTRQWIAGYLGCSARTVQKYINTLKGKKKEVFKEPSPKLEYAEGLLRDRLSTKVTITEKKITVSYTGIDDLNRVLNLMGALEKSEMLGDVKNV